MPRRIAILGVSAAAFELAEALRGNAIEVAAMVPPRAAASAAAARRTGAAGMAFIDPGPSINHAQTVARLADLGCDLLVNWGHSERLHPAVLRLCRFGVANLHPGAIPAARGREPVFGAMLEGWPSITQSVHLMGEAFDQGPVVATREIAIDDRPYRDTVEERLRMGAVAFYAAAVERILGGDSGIPPIGPSRYFPALADDADVIDWTETAEAILRRIRALSPFRPGRAWIPGVPEPFLIWRAELGTAPAGPAGPACPGQVLGVGAAGIDVCSADGAVRLTRHALGDPAGGGTELAAGVVLLRLRVDLGAP